MLAAASAAQAFGLLMAHRQVFPRQPATALVLIILAIVLVWEARRLARRAVYRNKLTAVVLPIVLGVLILVGIWAWIIADSEYLDLGWHLIDVAIAVHPDAWIVVISLAGGFLSLRYRWAKLTAFVLFVCAIVLDAVGKGLIKTRLP